MWFSEDFKDYELIDASDGERLERWDDVILVRPDPQIIWKGGKNSPLWNKADGVYKRKGGGGSWVVSNMPEQWTVDYRDLTFRIKPMGFKHTGIFPEQASNWDFIREKITSAKKNDSGRDIKVLNLFAYTGAASAAAVSAGAKVCHVDASKGMIAMAKENISLSSLPNDRCRFISDDCRKFVEREIRRGSRYDAVIMDPPSYGRGPNGEVWKLEDCVCDLIKVVCEVLTEDPIFILINSYTTGLSPAAMGYILTDTLSKKGIKGITKTDETGLKVSSTGLILPCGASARWEKL